MSLNSIFKSIEKNYALGIYGILLSIISIGLGYYWANQEKEPEIIFDILSNTEVFSLNENVSKLKVLYKDQNLNNENKRLSILTVRISNKGDLDIKESDYYSKSNFGFNLKNAVIAENPVIIDASSSFLIDNLEITTDSVNNVFINKIPLDKQQSFTVKLLSIVDANNSPEIIPFGNISGTNGQFSVLKSYEASIENEKSSTFFDDLFRILGYIFLGIIIFIALKILSSSALKSMKISEKVRKSIIERVTKSYDDYEIEVFDLLKEFYIKHGSSQLSWVTSVFTNYNYVEKFFEYKAGNRTLDEIFNTDSDYTEKNMSDEDKDLLRKIIFTTIDNGLIKMGDRGVEINVKFLRKIQGFYITLNDYEIDYQ